MRIEFGGGESPSRPDFYQCDCRVLPGIDYVCPAWDIDLASEEVDEIYSRHFFEHLTFAQGMATLLAWFYILKPGGTVEMILPDVAAHMRLFLGSSPQKQKQAALSIWGHQRHDLDVDWDVHKSGYDLYTLADTLAAAGFVGITEQGAASATDLHVTCRKPNGKG